MAYHGTSHLAWCDRNWLARDHFRFGPRCIVILLAVLWHVDDFLTILSERLFVLSKGFVLSRRDFLMGRQMLLYSRKECA